MMFFSTDRVQGESIIPPQLLCCCVFYYYVKEMVLLSPLPLLSQSLQSEGYPCLFYYKHFQEQLNICLLFLPHNPAPTIDCSSSLMGPQFLDGRFPLEDIWYWKKWLTWWHLLLMRLQEILEKLIINYWLNWLNLV